MSEQQMIMNGGMQYVPQIAVQQIIYLDFDGAQTVYNGEILSLDQIEVRDSLLTGERIDIITAALNAAYNSRGVFFVTTRPLAGAYSTVYIGKSDDFSAYGNFAGVAETIDKGNVNRSDNAFVLLDSSDTDDHIISVISHETEHLLGTLDHGGKGIAAYAAVTEYKVGEGQELATVDGTTYGKDEKLNVMIGGTATSVTITSLGQAEIYSGGVVNSITVSSGGKLTISSGAEVNYITESGGYIDVKEGAVVNFAPTSLPNPVFKEVSATFHEGLTASNVNITDNGKLYIYSGAAADLVTINNNASAVLYESATVTSAVLNKDGKFFASGGTLTDVQVGGKTGAGTNVNSKTGAVLNIGSGTTATGIWVNHGGTLNVSAGIGKVEIIENGGYVYIAPEAMENVTFLSNTFSDVTLHYRNVFHIHSNTIGSNIDLAESASLHISSGGTAFGAKTTYYRNWDANIYVSEGGVVSETLIGADWSYLHIYSGGYAASTTITGSGARATIYSGGSADAITIGGNSYNYSYLYVSSGGVATNINIIGHGGAILSSGAVATSVALLHSSAVLDVSSGASATDVVIANDADAYIHSGGVISNVTANITGHLYISSGASAVDIKENGGWVQVEEGAVVNFVSNTISGIGLGYRDSMTIHSNTIGSNIDLAESAHLHISSGGTAFGAKTTYYRNWDANIYVSEGGVVSETLIGADWSYLHIYSGGYAASTTITGSGARIHINSGGSADTITIGTHSYLYVSSGGVASNVIWTPGVGEVSAAVGASVHYASTYTGVYLASAQLLSHTETMTDKYAYYMNIFTGGIASNTTMRYNGTLHVSDGGAAVGINANSGYATINIHSGGVANDINLNAYNTTLNVYSGGSAANIRANTSRTTINVEDGATVDSVFMCSSATLDVKSGGTAYNVTWTPCVGNINSANGAVVTYANQSDHIGVFFGSDNRLIEHSAVGVAMTGKNVSGSCCSMYVMSGGTAVSATVGSSGYMYISNGGVASDTQLDGGGEIWLFAGGAASGTILNAGGKISVDNGGTMYGTIVNPGANLTISSGLVAYSTTVLEGGAMTIASGACANGVELTSGAAFSIGVGGSATEFNAAYGVSLYLTIAGGALIQGKYNNIDFEVSAGHLSNYTMNIDGVIAVASGGIAEEITLNAGGNFHISGGGKISSAIVNDGGQLIVSSGGSSFATTVNNNGKLYISGGKDSGSILTNGANVTVYSGGATVETEVNSKAVLTISSGGSGVFIKENGGRVTLEAGASATFASNTISGMEMDDKTSATLHANTVASDTIINNGGILSACGGIASATTINNGGTLEVTSGGIAATVTVNQGGKLTIHSGGVLNGTADLLTGAVVTVSSGGIVDFNLKGRTPDTENASGSPYIINNLALIKGSPKYTVTIGHDLQSGTYKLAQGAAGFTGSITICNERGVEYSDHVITVNSDAVEIYSVRYTLNQINGDLTLDVLVLDDTTPPDKPTITTNTSGVTNGNVILTAVFSPDTVKAEYKIGNGTWQSYTGPVEIDSNATVTFKATDAAGNSSTSEFDVNNIDKSVPLDPDITANITDPTPENVVLKAEFNIDDNDTAGATIQYRLSGTEEWLIYDAETGVICTENCTVQFRIIDQAFNCSNIVEYVVSNIDKAAPDAPIASLSNTNPTNKDVTLSVTFDSGSVKNEYRVDGGKWKIYEGDIICSENARYEFRSTDAAGNVSAITAVNVGNIDKVAPITPVVKVSTGEATGRDVVVTASFASDSVRNEYSTDGGKHWSVYSKFLICEENCVLMFRSFDAVGNQSEIAVVDVANIDKIAPKLTLSANTTGIVVETELVAMVDDGSTIWYSRDNVEWFEYTSPITVKQNGIWYFKVSDEAGNTAKKAISFNNIDSNALTGIKVTPDKENTEYSGGNVFVTAEFTGHAKYKQYSTDKITWQQYRGPIECSNNITIYFREIDAKGNVSEIREYEVKNVDKSAPYIPVGFNTEFTNDGTSVSVTVSWNDVDDQGISGLAKYEFNYGTRKLLYMDNTVFITADPAEGEITSSSITLTDLPQGTLYCQVRSIDNVGNVSAWSEVFTIDVSGMTPDKLTGTSGNVNWSEVSGAATYIVEYSNDGFQTFVSFETDSCTLDTGALPAGSWQWRVRAAGGEIVESGETINSDYSNSGSEKLSTTEDGNFDVIFANAKGVWDSGFSASHQGELGRWNGTGELCSLDGKNMLSDIFEASDDADVLVMTDDENGDALFVDDIYSELPGSVAEQQARIARIDEIRAGAGDDIVDMTSQQFAYTGGGIRICGGSGNDCIWANNGNNILYGDAGNDRLVGGTDADIIIGGSGNDSMHGGGGDDIFTFGGSWGCDTIEQTAGGTVTLWFESGSEADWDAAGMTYTQGDDSVTVTGISAENVILKFGGDISGLPAFSFDDESSSRIFEDRDKAMLA